MTALEVSAKLHSAHPTAFHLHFPVWINSMCGRSTVQNQGCHPSSTFLCLNKLLWIIPPLLLPIHHQVALSGALHPCSFSLLLLFHRGCAIASATLLLTLGHQGNFHPTGMSASSDGFWGNTKKLGVCEVQHKQSWKEQKRILKYHNLTQQCQKQELKFWLKRPH